MEAARLKQVEEIYHAAIELAPKERESFFKISCGADENLRREVESLLLFENTFDSLIDTPPESLAAEMLYGRAKNLKGKKLGHYKILFLTQAFRIYYGALVFRNKKYKKYVVTRVTDILAAFL